MPKRRWRPISILYGGTTGICMVYPKVRKYEIFDSQSKTSCIEKYEIGCSTMIPYVLNEIIKNVLGAL